MAAERGFRVVLCEALRSIFTSRKGSSVARNCRDSLRADVAGVVTLSAIKSHPRSAALRTYPSLVVPNAKSSPGESMPVFLPCPKTSPTLGKKLI